MLVLIARVFEHSFSEGCVVSKFCLSAVAILSAAALAFSASAAIAVPATGTLTVYGTASGETGPQYTAGTILISDTV
ncbi:MAG: hypothetical protein WCH79_14965, partial [Planctomycetia bacterium]